MDVCFPHFVHYAALCSLLGSAIQRHFRGMFPNDMVCGSFHDDIIIHKWLERAGFYITKGRKCVGFKAGALKPGAEPTLIGLGDLV